ncbi:MAG: hypothetical protein QOG80_3098 [Pseudonocardiales bacterium]|jgi:anti-anti-sigma factor|nr:hypothetical protein [Pseudonocardiales bacterium]
MSTPPVRDTLRDQFDIDLDVAEREIRVFGEVDMMTAPLLTAAATSMLTSAPGDLVLDLAGVTFADSALLHAIDQMRAALDDDDECEVRLLNASAAVKRLFLAGGSAELLHDAQDPVRRPPPRLP